MFGIIHCDDSLLCIVHRHQLGYCRIQVQCVSNSRWSHVRTLPRGGGIKDIGLLSHRGKLQLKIRRSKIYIYIQAYSGETSVPPKLKSFGNLWDGPIIRNSNMQFLMNIHNIYLFFIEQYIRDPGAATSLEKLATIHGTLVHLFLFSIWIRELHSSQQDAL